MAEMPTPILKVAKPSSAAQKMTMTTIDTIGVTPESIAAWKIPPFQRNLRVNPKVVALAEKIKLDGGVIPGVITIGIMDKTQFLLDGQHRREAFLLSGCKQGYVDVRMHHFDKMSEMGQEFVNLNSQLVRLKPDDILRGLEGSCEPLAKIRKKCPYAGYDMIRRSEKAPIVSMSALLRCWFGSASETPAIAGSTAVSLVDSLTMDEADTLIDFLDLAITAWGKDASYSRLWLNLNLCISMWLYRRLVIAPYSPNVKKMTKDQFTKCLMALSADSTYLDWLVGRQLRETDRSPAYKRMKELFAKRVELDTGTKPRLPSPSWCHSSGSKRE